MAYELQVILLSQPKMNTFDVVNSSAHTLTPLITVLARGKLLWVYCFDLGENSVHFLIKKKKAVSFEKVIFSHAWNTQGIFAAILF